MSKLFDRLKNAARLRSGASAARGSLLAQALRRASEERERGRAANRIASSLEPAAVAGIDGEDTAPPPAARIDLESQGTAEPGAAAFATTTSEALAQSEGAAAAMAETAAAEVLAVAQGPDEEELEQRVATHAPRERTEADHLAQAAAQAMQVSAKEPRPPTVTAEREERDLRVGAPKKRATLGIAGALVLVALVALAVFSSRFAQRAPEAAPVPTFQIDKTLR